MILGVSYDTPAENKAFAEKYRFPYALLSDQDQAIAKAYGAFADGQGYPSRNTYLIGSDGTLEKVYAGVNAKTHPADLLAEL